MNEVAMGVFSYLLPVGITLFGVYLAYTGFNKVSTGVLYGLFASCAGFYVVTMGLIRYFL